MGRASDSQVAAPPAEVAQPTAAAPDRQAPPLLTSGKLAGVFLSPTPEKPRLVRIALDAESLRALGVRSERLTDADFAAWSNASLRPWLAARSATRIGTEVDSLDLFENEGLHTPGMAAVLDALADHGVKVRRLKAWQTGADDSTVEMFAAWMRRYAPADRPFEVHFSHCRVTDWGLNAIIAGYLTQVLWSN